jgi:thiol-disulfide isomerase/thioredoxin
MLHTGERMSRSPLFAVVFAGCIPRLEGTTEPVSDWLPPDNTWEQTTPPAELVGEGYDVGDVVPDFRLVDQHGDEVSLWQFYGDVILLDVSTIWCGPCQDLAAFTEETQAEYRDQGFTYLTVLQQDYEGGPPVNDDLLFWADTFGITGPVLDDGQMSTVNRDQWPTVMTIGRNMKVKEIIDPPSDANVRSAIEGLL